MKKIISLFICIIIIFSLTACGSSYKGEIYKDNNNNYKSSDVDENGNIISKEENNSTYYPDNPEIESSENKNPIKPIKEENLIVYFIDCGNADATFIKLPGNKTMLIDAGNNADGDDLCVYISRLGYSKIDYVIGTHPHEDHIGGLDDIINTFDIGNIYLPRIPNTYVPSTQVYESVLTSIANKKNTIISPSSGQIIYNENDTIVEFLNSSDNIYSEDMNLYSLVVRIQYKDKVFIFAADAIEENETIILNDFNKDYLNCDVLKIGHHGSYTSSSKNWIKTLNPEYVFIPCGKNNEYDHPHDIIIDRLKDYDANIYRADKDGTVIMKTNGKEIEIQKKMTGKVPLGDPEWNSSMIKTE